MANTDSDDDHFGLPDPDFKPLEELSSQEQPVPETAGDNSNSSNAEFEPLQDEYKAETDEQAQNNQPTIHFSDPNRFEAEENRKKRNTLLAILIPAILLIAGFFIYQYWIGISLQKEQAAAAAKKAQEEQRLRDELAKKKKEIPVIQTPTIPTPGSIQTLEAPTGQYYVVVHSSIDGDLIMDQAKKFSAEGISSVIIPPFGKWKFHRLSITSEGTFSLAQQQANQLKEKYGQDLWVLRY